MSIYSELGVKTYINAHGYFTRYGGAVVHSDILRAMREASGHSVLLTELQSEVGKAIARLTHNQAAYVSCGAFSGVLLAVAACMAGTDKTLASRLPDTTQMTRRVLMYRADAGFKCDAAVRCSGATITLLDHSSTGQLCHVLGELSPDVAAMLLVLNDKPGKPPLPNIVDSCHRYNVPVIVDGAGAVPPRENLWRFTRDYQVDAFIVSGGKGIGGPQSTGLILGTPKLISACAFHGFPNDRIGRGMKVGKEELIGIYAAVKRVMTQAYCDHDEQSRHLAETIMEQGGRLDNIALRRSGPYHIAVSPKAGCIPSKIIQDWFRTGMPGVLVGSGDNGVEINTCTLQGGDEAGIVYRLVQLSERLGRNTALEDIQT